jgi:hypothetical protein
MSVALHLALSLVLLALWIGFVFVLGMYLLPAACNVRP